MPPVLASPELESPDPPQPLSVIAAMATMAATHVILLFFIAIPLCWVPCGVTDEILIGKKQIHAKTAETFGSIHIDELCFLLER